VQLRFFLSAWWIAFEVVARLVGPVEGPNSCPKAGSATSVVAEIRQERVILSRAPRYDPGRPGSSRKVKDKQALGRILGVAAGIAVATALHYLTSPSLILWHQLFQRLYYLPIIYAAIFFGWRGGLLASLVSALCYIPHILMAWHHMPEYALNQYAEIIVFFLVGSVTGVLADRGRRQRAELQLASEKLAKVNRELQDSFEQIKRADRLSAIGQLSASLAHEIRNPLASIDGAANLIESPQTSDEMRKGSLAIIHKEIQRLNRLLTNLLDFARPKKPEFQPVDPSRLIDSIISLAGHSAEQKGIILRKEVPASVPPFECDPEQMKQVILNLAINAIQAMTAPGEVLLSARPSNSSVMISVRDEGPGVDDEKLDKIFNPFFTTKEAGTGLGLSVVHQIITQHGGVVNAERNPDGGMTFSLVIPQQQRRKR
jgi:two-component system sensor histidine kinase HydH